MNIKSNNNVMRKKKRSRVLVSLIKIDGKPPYTVYEPIEIAVRESLDLIGGLSRIVSSGDIVLIKPNLVAPMKYTTGATTNVEVLRALIRLSKECGAKSVIIGEGCEAGESTKHVFEVTGVDNLAEEEGAQLIDFKKDERVAISIPSAKVLKRLFLPRIIFEADVLINVPVLKTHTEFPATLGLKNMKGILFDSDKRKLHRKGLSAGIVDISRVILPELTVADGTIAMEGFGPCNGNPVNLGIIVTSTDPVACDSVCCEIMGVPPMSVQYIKEAYIANIGEAERRRIQIMGNSVKKLRRPFKRTTFDEIINSNCFKLFDQNACSGCQHTIATLFNELVKMRDLGASKDYAFIIGQNASIGDVKRKCKNETMVFLGKCQKMNENIGELYFNGCPPNGIQVALDIIQRKMIR
jgi:uncharacterized protein (DUF362 family)